MQMPSKTEDTSRTFNSSNMEVDRQGYGTDKATASVHNKVANFVLELRGDVTLEDVLEDSSDSRKVTVETAGQRQCPGTDKNDVHRKYLEHLYMEIKNHQNGLINSHEQSTKRRSSEGAMGFKRKRGHQHSENMLLQDADCIDENWLMNLASQLGLDQNVDLPELNFDLVKEII